MRFLRVCCCLGVISFASTWAADGGMPDNSWIKPSDGKWEEAGGWSLGILPAGDQEIFIANANTKTVEINAATAANFPSSLVLHRLVLQGNNTLKLNRTGPSGALQFVTGSSLWSGIEVHRDASVITLDSDIIMNGYFGVAGRFEQDGGRVTVNNSSKIFGGLFSLTSGVFETGDQLILWANGKFIQHGGEVRFGSLRTSDSVYEMHGGEVSAVWGISVEERGAFVQNGGLNRGLEVTVVGGTGRADYKLNGGTLAVSKLNVYAGMSEGKFEQNGGIQIVTNAVQLIGSARYYPPIPIEASYIINKNGVAKARELEMNSTLGFCLFENYGQTEISENIRFFGSPEFPSQFQLAAGTVTCSNLVVESGIVDIYQTGGALEVAEKFIFNGFYPGISNGQRSRLARYDFMDGTFRAKHIELGGEWVIPRSLSGGRIENTGTFRMGGTLRVGTATEQFGKFILSSNATINLGDGEAKISFARSDAEEWNSSAILTVLNWEGWLQGGGVDQLWFGTDRNGLSAAQVAQIRFVDPWRAGTGVYRAEILETGEVVPGVIQQVSHTKTPGGLVLTWQRTGILQTSTNAAGPYESLPSATSPHIIEEFPGAQRFFRVLE